MVRWNGSILKGNTFTRQAKRAFGVQSEVQYCHPQYDFTVCAICEAEGRYPLTIATLKPRDKTRPSFSLRWDPKGGHLNVDIKNVSQEVRELFKKGEQGYVDHRPKMVAEKVFYVKISIPTEDVFIGKISFKIHENIALRENVGIGEKLVVVLKKDGESRTIE